MPRAGAATALAALLCSLFRAAHADNATNSLARSPAADKPAPGKAAEIPEEIWNWHVQNTDIVQGDPGFPARYSGPNSLNSRGEIQDTVSLDLFAGLRLWRGAEAHLDGLVWQGFGLSKTRGIEAFPNGEAYRVVPPFPTSPLRGCFFANPSTWAATRRISRTTNSNCREHKMRRG